MGQTFTSTVGTIEVKPDQVRDIDDIERNGRVFSDGCGKIYHSLAEKAIKRYWGKRDIIDKEIPSVYQIRFRGCKVCISLYFVQRCKSFESLLILELFIGRCCH